jgi:dihydroorotase
MDFYKKGIISMEQIVEKMCHTPARIFNVEKRGFIKPGYFADLVIVDPNKPYTAEKENILYKCKWSPFEGHTFASTIIRTFVNGKLVYDNGQIDPRFRGMRLSFDR